MGKWHLSSWQFIFPIHYHNVAFSWTGHLLLRKNFKHIVICLKFCWAHVIMTFPPEWTAALAVICSMCVRAIFNSTFRKHQSLSKSKHNHGQLNKFSWILNSKTHPVPHIFSPLVYVLWRCQWLHLFFPERIVAIRKITYLMGLTSDISWSTKLPEKHYNLEFGIWNWIPWITARILFCYFRTLRSSQKSRSRFFYTCIARFWKLDIRQWNISDSCTLKQSISFLVQKHLLALKSTVRWRYKPFTLSKARQVVNDI